MSYPSNPVSSSTPPSAPMAPRPSNLAQRFLARSGAAAAPISMASSLSSATSGALASAIAQALPLPAPLSVTPPRSEVPILASPSLSAGVSLMPASAQAPSIPPTLERPARAAAERISTPITPAPVVISVLPPPSIPLAPLPTSPRARLALTPAAAIVTVSVADIDALKAREATLSLELDQVRDQISCLVNISYVRTFNVRNFSSSAYLEDGALVRLEKLRKKFTLSALAANRPFLDMIHRLRDDYIPIFALRGRNIQALIEAMAQFEVRILALRRETPDETERLLLEIVSQSDTLRTTDDLLNAHLFEKLSEMHRRVTAWLRENPPVVAAPATPVPLLSITIRNTRIILTQGDLLKEHVQAIVHATDEECGANLDGFSRQPLDRFYTFGGPAFLDTARQLPARYHSNTSWGPTAPDYPCAIGRAVTSSSGNLRDGDLRQLVIHTTPPSFDETGEIGSLDIARANARFARLRDCHTNCLQEANEARLSSIAFPTPIRKEGATAEAYHASTSVAAAFAAIRTYLELNAGTTLREIRLVANPREYFRPIEESARSVVTFDT